MPFALGWQGLSAAERNYLLSTGATSSSGHRRIAFRAVNLCAISGVGLRLLRGLASMSFAAGVAAAFELTGQIEEI
jgi:hypothetical protein